MNRLLFGSPPFASTRFAYTPPRRSAKRLIHLSAFLLAAVLGGGCAPTASGGKSAAGDKCTVPPKEGPGPATPLTSIEYPKSQVWVVADVPYGAVSEGLSRQIPFTLASEDKRDVGAPGYATYRVTRGTPKVLSTKDGLKVEVPVNADISVCKKIGSACIQYGSCKPSFLATFSLNPAIGDDFQMAPPEGTISATKRCVIGLDVTSQIEQIARAEVAKVEAEIKRQWPIFKPEVGRAWREMRKPIPIADDNCVYLEPNKIFYQTVHLEGSDQAQHLQTAIGLSGSVAPAADCKKKRGSTPLPKPKTKGKPPNKSSLWIPEVKSLETVQAELQESLTGPIGSDGELRVKEVRLETQRVLLHIEATGAVCGSFWLEGRLSHRAGAEALTLNGLKVIGGEAPPEMAKLLEHVAASARVKLDSASWFSHEATQPLLASLTAAVPKEVKFDVKDLKAGDAKVVAASDGLYVLHPLTASLVVSGF